MARGHRVGVRIEAASGSRVTPRLDSEWTTGKTLDLASAIASKTVGFIATKLEAFAGRGAGNFLTSHDIEDVLNIVDWREELTAEIAEPERSALIYRG